MSLSATSEEGAALRLWNSAYQEIRQDNEQLTEAYERILTLNINDGVGALTAAAANIFANGAAEARIQRMAISVQKSLEKIHERRSIRGGVMQASALLAKLEKVGKLALTPAPPPATMAWSGICAAVQILSGPFEAEQSMVDGLEHVIARMDCSLESQVRTIYRAILTYEMTAVLYCYKDHRVFAYAKVVWGSYDWTTQRSKLAKLEERLDGDMAHYSSRESVAALRSLLHEASESSGLLQEIASGVQQLSSIQQARQDQQTQRDAEERTRRRDLLIGRFKTIPYEERMRINPLRGTVKFLVTTRGLPPILNHLDVSGQGHIHLDGDGKTEKDLIQKEIQLVVEHRLSQLAEKKRLDDAKRKILKDGFALKGGEDRTYLWASLVFESLEKNNDNTQKGWRDLVSNLPKTVYGAYERLHRQVSHDDAEKVGRLFHLIIAAQRPLTLEEMDIALCAWENVQGKLAVCS
ncbi:hypothetical protein D7B24_002283 [Verticillium nonalfalfae]|uniref:Uncharacterized protein n=1 Tax=Verticillium nonalfalfae TaxID=1051616 RepID=A0A3M9XYR0_9PEZI|nr:uncharacterized protein D7B24_002283 [Verticillium nonalfalfae]RNJ53171.1 hypothetical protein D7B24_002283 [Verticillium nonalfalfae]